MTSPIKSIAWNTIVQIVGKILSASVGIFITALLARYFGPAGFGTYSFVLVFVTLFGVISDWGLSLIAVRESSNKENEAGEILGNVVFIRLSLACLSALFAVLVSHFWLSNSPAGSLVGLAAVYLLALSLKTSFQTVFQAKLQMHWSAITDILSNLLMLSLVVVIISFHGSIQSALGSLVLANFLSALFAGIVALRVLPLKFRLITKNTKYLLWEALPMGAILGVFTIYNRLDTVILSHFKGMEAVGFYAVSYRIYDVLTLGAAYFANAILPTISRLAVSDPEKLRKFYQRSLFVVVILGFVVALANFVLAPLAVLLAGGKSYGPAILPLQILSLAVFVTYLNHLSGYTLIALKKQWVSFRIAVFALFLNIVMNWLLIPHFSYVAAAFITFLTEGSIAVVSLVVIGRELRGQVVPSWQENILLIRQILDKVRKKL